MNLTNRIDTFPSPAAPAKFSQFVWRRAGLASILAAGVLATAAFAPQSFATSEDIKSAVQLLNIELATTGAALGDGALDVGATTTIANAAPKVLAAALKAAVAETSNPVDGFPNQLEFFIQAIAQARGATFVAESTSYVTAIVDGLKLAYDQNRALMQEPMLNVLAETSRIVALKMGADAASGTTAVAVQGKIATAITKLYTPVFKGLIASDLLHNPGKSLTDVSSDAAKVVTQAILDAGIQHATLGSEPQAMTTDELVVLAANAVKGVAVAYQGDAAAKAATAVYNHLYPSATPTTEQVTALTLSTLKAMPADGAQAAAAALMAHYSLTAAQLVTEVRSNYIAKGLVTPAALTAMAKVAVAKADSITDKEQVVKDLSAFLQNPAKVAAADMLADATRAALVAGAVLTVADDAAKVSTLINAVDSVIGTSGKAGAKATAETLVIQSVVTALAKAKAATIGTVFSNFVTTNGANYVGAVKQTLAGAVLSTVAKISKTQGDWTAVGNIVANSQGLRATSDLAGSKTLAALLAKTAGGDLKACVALGKAAASWQVSGADIDPAGLTVGLFTDVTALATKANLAAGVASAYIGKASLNTVVSAAAASAVSAAVKPAEKATVANAFISQLGASAISQVLTATSPSDAIEKGTFAGLIAAAAPLQSGTVAALLSGASNPLKSSIAVAMIKKVSTNADAVSAIVANTYPASATVQVNVAYAKAVVGANAAAAPKVGTALGVQIKSHLPADAAAYYQALFNTAEVTGDPKTTISAWAKGATVIAGVAVADQGNVSTIIDNSVTAGNGAAVAAAVVAFQNSPSAVVAVVNQVANKTALTAAAGLGVIAKGVVATTPGLGNADLVVTNLASKLKSMTADVNASNIAGKDVSKAVATEKVTRITDLGVLAGSAAALLSGSTIDATAAGVGVGKILTATTTGSMSFTGALAHTVDVGALFNDPSTDLYAITYVGKATALTGAATSLFYNTLLNAKVSGNSIALNSVAGFTGKVLLKTPAAGSGIANGWAKYVARSAVDAAGKLSSVNAAISDLFVPGLSDAALANVAVGLTLFDKVNASSYAGTVANVYGLNDINKGRIAVAVAVSLVVPDQAFKVAKAVAATFTAASQDQGRIDLVTAMIGKVSKLFTKITASEQIGLLVGSICQGASATSIAAVVDAAVKLKPLSTFQIVGSVLSLGASQSVSLQSIIDAINGAYSANQLVQNAIKYVQDGKTGSFFTSGNITGQETPVQGL